MASFWERITVGSQDMDLYLSLPTGSGPFPAVLIGPHADGLDSFIQWAAGQLAEEGYTAVAPDLFHQMGENTTDETSQRLQDPNDAGLSARVAATMDYLRISPSVGQERIGVTGFGMGGRAAWLAAATCPGFNASVPFYGGDILKPLGDAAGTPLALAGGIACPIMFHFGEDDENPSQADMRTLDTELTRLGKPHQFFIYPGSGHGFMDPAGPHYRKRPSQAAWIRTLEFFTVHLKGLPIR
ncbi:MAG: dienelactone hydrolase family protein [Dehalococcoidia bacterium]|nr:dienelactone hydrolase family protein [Dehalococcoidia bacterium]